MLPKSLDEMRAEDENDMLSRDELVQAEETDNHTTHIYTHSMVQPKTLAVWFHLEEHRRMLAEQMKLQQDMAEAEQAEASSQMVEPGKPKFSKEQKSPRAQASPLKTETKSEINK